MLSSASTSISMGDCLPTMASVAVQLTALYSGEDYSTEDVIGTIERDPPIASRILRLANSPFFGFPCRVSDLAHAVTLLGPPTVQALALGTALIQPWGGKEAPEPVADLWVHSYLCGLGCRAAANLMPNDGSHSEPNTMFLLGLLHDIGKFFFLTYDPEAMTRALSSEIDEEDLLEWEAKRFGMDHCEAGGELLRAWSMPQKIAAAAEWHHNSANLRAQFKIDVQITSAVDKLERGKDIDEADHSLPSHVLMQLQKIINDRRPRIQRLYRLLKG